MVAISHPGATTRDRNDKINRHSALDAESKKLKSPDSGSVTPCLTRSLKL